MFHARSLVNYEKEKEKGAEKISDLAGNLYSSFKSGTLAKLYLLFCPYCKRFDSPFSTILNFKNMFTNSYCYVSNNVLPFELKPNEVDALGVAFRAYYHQILYPTREIARFQICGFFKLIGLQILIQMLVYHRKEKDSKISLFLDKVLIFNISF